MRGLREALAGPAIRLFLVAAAALSAMTWAFTIVLAIAAYRHGGVAGVGGVTTVRLLAAAVAAPLTALLGDLFSRRAVLLGLAGTSAVLLAGMALLEASGGPFALLVILAAALTAATTGNRPTEAALLVGLCAGPRELGSASATWSALDNAGFLVGSLAGGAAAAVSAETGFLLAAVLCALATIAVAAMPSDGRPQHRARLRDTPIVRDLVLGARELVRTPLVRDAAGLLVGLAALDGILDVVIVAVAYDVLGLAIASVGWLNAAWGAGGVLGGLGAAALLGRARLPLAIAAGAVGMGAALALLATAPGPISAVALFVLFGAAYALVDSGATTSVQRLASDEALARVFGVIESAGLIGAAAGAAGAAALVDAVGTRAALIAIALPLPLFVLLRRRAVLRLRPDTSAPPDRLRLLRSLDVFAPLALATIETLAMRSVERRAAPGEELIRAGDRGDRFYVVLEGVVEIHLHGVLRRLEGRGEYFGEIALLHDVPRTADVHAHEPSLLLAVGRQDFLAAVTGQARALATADAVAGRRLAADTDSDTDTDA